MPQPASRCLFLKSAALSGAALDAPTALAWGLVDEIRDAAAS